MQTWILTFSNFDVHFVFQRNDNNRLNKDIVVVLCTMKIETKNSKIKKNKRITKDIPSNQNYVTWIAFIKDWKEFGLFSSTFTIWNTPGILLKRKWFNHFGWFKYLEIKDLCFNFKLKRIDRIICDEHQSLGMFLFVKNDDDA